MPNEDNHDLAHEIHELHEAIDGYNKELEFFRKACYAIIGLVAMSLGLDVNLLM